MPDDSVVLSTQDLTKIYGGRVVVDRINLTLRRQEIYGFLGPNGAGKTTTIRMLLGLVPPTAGQVMIMGHPMTGGSAAVKKRLGVVGEQDRFFEEATARDYLCFFADYYRIDNPHRRVDELLERFELLPFANALASKFSHGMQRKLSLARALLHHPSVLILDEPASGLDPFGILQVRKALEDERRAGCSILISSHILSEIERTANRVGIIHKGRLLTEESVEAVRSRLTPETVIEVELQSAIPGIAECLNKLPEITRAEINGKQITLTAAGGGDLRPAISRAITDTGGVIIGMQVKQANLEEAFIRLTNENLVLMQPGQCEP